jgi:peptide deformylase
MLRPILIHPDPRLKKLCDPVGEIDDGVRGLARDMFETMYGAPGIGLAAPQIGVNARLIVMDCAKREDEHATPQPVAMVNPEITWSSDELCEREEGCLSIPEIYAPVSRPEAVTVRWTDLDGQTREARMAGIWATCVQHEIDHLNGKLFIDYLGPMRRQMITSRMKKLKRERARA